MSGDAVANNQKQAWFHVDMDGLETIYRANGAAYKGGADSFYLSAVENSLALFAEQGVKATYFVVGKDLEDKALRGAIESVVRAGHNIGCHGLEHHLLYHIPMDKKRQETVTAKAVIEDRLGVPCLGYRAAGCKIDFESLQLLREAGFLYDSSIFPDYGFKRRLGIERLYTEPFLLFPEDNFFEVPLPYVGAFLPRFHPCYSFYLTRYYFNLCLTLFERVNNHFTLLFHLTDFARPQRLNQSVRLGIMTNNYFPEWWKMSFLHKVVKRLRRNFAITTTEEFLAGWPETAPELSPRTILGVSTTHETGACLLQDGEILAAVTEERLSRKKLDNAYPPIESVREVVRIAGVDPSEIDAVAIAGLHTKDLARQSWVSFWEDARDFHAINDYVPHLLRMLYRIYYFWRAMHYGRVLPFLKKEYDIQPRAYYVEHHEAHAASAFRTAETDDAFIITADGVGDDVTMTFGKGEGTLIRRLESFFYPHSLGQFYTACTQILGFKGGRHEGKITGLSGFGKMRAELAEKLNQTLILTEGFKLHKKYYAEGFVRLRPADLIPFIRGQLTVLNIEYHNYKTPLKKLLAGYKREDVAHAFQSILEREMVRLAQRHLPPQKERPLHLVLAGGVFANVKLNMALSEQLDADSIYIFPAMGDGGLCVGAALNVAAAPAKPLANAYLGTGYGEAAIESALTAHNHLTYTRPENMAETAAKLLAQQKIMARFDGRMEFGPRALGNRTILYHCGDPSVNDWLNTQLRRTEFMPFAPICIFEDAEDYFFMKEGEKRPCEYMTLVVRCTDRMKETCPAAVHVDGTARPQLLRRATNPGMYDIMCAYKELTGISCLINTSFNMHEEPIVRTPEEALVAFEQSNLDYLIMGPYLVNGRQEMKG